MIAIKIKEGFLDLCRDESFVWIESHEVYPQLAYSHVPICWSKSFPFRFIATSCNVIRKINVFRLLGLSRRRRSRFWCLAFKPMPLNGITLWEKLGHLGRWLTLLTDFHSSTNRKRIPIICYVWEYCHTWFWVWTWRTNAGVSSNANHHLSLRVCRRTS